MREYMKRNYFKLIISIVGILVSIVFLIMSVSAYSSLKRDDKKTSKTSASSSWNMATIEDAHSTMRLGALSASRIESKAGNTINEAFFQDSGRFMLGLSDLLKNTSETVLDNAVTTQAYYEITLNKAMSSQVFYAFVSTIVLLGFAYMLSLELEKSSNKNDIASNNNKENENPLHQVSNY